MPNQVSRPRSAAGRDSKCGCRTRPGHAFQGCFTPRCTRHTLHARACRGSDTAAAAGPLLYPDSRIRRAVAGATSGTSGPARQRPQWEHLDATPELRPDFAGRDWDVGGGGHCWLPLCVIIAIVARAAIAAAAPEDPGRLAHELVPSLPASAIISAASAHSRDR